ncbi:hypothetical protein [Noviherbaspirillum cavernae]|nr:hypothetical protein [Noviherbaspirillum cavernae]
MVEVARKDGVTLALSDTDTIKLAGHKLAVKRWMPLIRQNKPAILAVLLEEAAVADENVGHMSIATLTTDDDLTREAALAHHQANDLSIQDDFKRQRRNEGDVPDRAEEAPRSITFGDERRTCTQCRNLMPSGQCMAAIRGELNATQTYEPIQDLLQRCAGYLPGPDDADQRTGHERRWPA